MDLTVTSPPYDNLRTYNGNIEQWSFEKFQGIAKDVVWSTGSLRRKGFRLNLLDDGGRTIWKSA